MKTWTILSQTIFPQLQQPLFHSQNMFGNPTFITFLYHTEPMLIESWCLDQSQSGQWLSDTSYSHKFTDISQLKKLTSELKVVYEADHAIMVDGYDYMVSDVSLIDDTAE